MSSPLDRPLQINLRLPSNHPQLLEGLDIWLRLGLISDAKVRQICSEYLICAVIFQSQVESQPEVFTTSYQRTTEPLIATLPPEPQQPAKPNFVTSMLQSLGEELSVRWLLFLGVFLVVISSGVLAASQWERFPAVGQYGVLLTYTLSFWGFTFWAGKQSNLRLTAQTLLAVTLLLVPVNFWAMDSFGLWQSPVNWLVMAIAALILSAITSLLCSDRTIIANFPRGKLPLVNLLGLSYLHWGWQFPGFPLVAVYLAMVGTTFTNVYQSLKYPQSNANEQSSWGKGIYFAAIIYSLLTLLSRAIFLAGVNVTQLGLAIGICGWLVTWLAQQHLTLSEEADREVREDVNFTISPSALLWEQLGGILLFLGWLVSVVTQPAQAIAVSGLSLWVFSRRVQKYSSRIDLAAFFLVGLQTIWLGWRLVPDPAQRLIIATATTFTNAQTQPWALLSVALFPYIILMLVLSHRWGRDKPELETFGEQLTLILGVGLTMLGLLNPLLRSLNLLFSTITLATVTKRRSFVPFLVYLTHITAVLTLCSTINWLSPNLNKDIWAAILLVIMVGEWVFSLGEGIWQRSSWYIGLGLAAQSFAFLFVNVQSSATGIIYVSNQWGVIWLITPLALTGLASRTREQKQTINTFVSVLAVIASQFLTLAVTETRLIGLGVGVGVMFINTRYVKKQELAGLTIGLGLSFIAALLWIIPDLTLSIWVMAGAIAIFSLWVGSTLLLRQNQELTEIYSLAADKWAIALCGVELLVMTVHSALVYQNILKAGIFYIIATAITLGAIIYRSWQQPSNIAFYSIGWCLELLAAEILGFGEHSIVKIAIANIALGFSSQIFGEWWKRKYQLAKLPSSFHILPLIYGAFSIVLRLTTFTNWTGFCSLGVALILVGVGRRREEFKPLLYLGIIGISISAYELLFYQMFQATGGQLGDGLIAMSALGTSILYFYRILAPWLVNYFQLSLRELKNIAHLHWVWSSGLFLVAVIVPLEINLYVAIGTGAFLIRYAIWQGRRDAITPRNIIGNITLDEIWVYLGLFTAGITGLYLQKLPNVSFWSQLLLPWQGAIACVIAYFLYILPWETWGWSKTPWQRAAYILPLIIVGQTSLQISSITLAIVAIYYIFIAKIANAIRFTYLSVALIDWALFNWFFDLRLTNSLWYVTPIGLSFLYIAQIDPQLQLPETKNIRHIWRIVASSIICGWPVLFHQNLPLIPGIFSLIAIFAGLALRIRAFLYVGTAAFFCTSIYQLVIFSLRYSFLKWIVGLLVGILLIYIAANFETRRTQINTLLRNSSNQFEDWQ
ncbi:hypothetical protein B6N60_04432 [Richelia sinica FACHB-800]|uniref:DUF2157 domain-containing protein n=1 Tax=Richelia sinica FACHB-800 TaxID=1357546 RepID=A0A975TCU7_9NOST|nr:DUF2157 domain-containing protein [Richelia sinica]MBD2665434.1 DUF2157 domain-containing protein [Richelia sinica FACHB-800]QXE25712.1 hypothetical protein B6N60_04432 [Richelia sinica FACHB-800]